MNLNSLFPLQEKLDNHIVEKHELEDKKLILEKKNALNCELWECANESRVFKFWSNKGIDREALKEEYVDVIHFLISIANELGYEKHVYKDIPIMDLNRLFNGISNMITMIPTNKEKEHLSKLFNHVIKLGYQLDFTESDVIEAYHSKHEENYERQANGY